MRYIKEVSATGFSVLDLDKSVEFYTRIMGLEVIERDGDVARLRGTGSRAPVLTLAKGDTPSIDYIAVITQNLEAATELAENLEAKGYALIDRPGTAYPEGQHGFEVADPDGLRIRVIGQPANLVPQQRANQPVGISHIALNCGDIEKVRAFYTDGLGLQFRDSARRTGLVFLGCDKLHHRIALMGGFDEPRVNHVSFEIPDLEGFLRKAGQMVRDGGNLIAGPGRHDTGDNTFAYFADPDERVVEISTGMEVVDPENWTPRLWISGMDQWGFGIPLFNEEMRRRTL